MFNLITMSSRVEGLDDEAEENRLFPPSFDGYRELLRLLGLDTTGRWPIVRGDPIEPQVSKPPDAATLRMIDFLMNGKRK